MTKRSIQDIAAILVERNGVDIKEAEAFVVSFFRQIREALKKDTIVKIKGLGTFKIINVEQRESVNVTTGSRMVIDSHSKLTFIPDQTMRELVNRPFSQFQTVVLNDGVDLSELEARNTEQTKDDDEEETETVDILPVYDESEFGSEPERESSAETVEAEGSEPERESSAETEDESEPERESSAETVVAEGSEPERERHNRWLLYVLIAPVLVILAFLGGFFLGGGRFVKNTKPPGEEPVLPAEHINQAVRVDTVIPSDTLARGKKDTAAVEFQQTPPKEPDYLKYDKMDRRCHYGAYYIVGTSYVFVARDNDNVIRIAHNTLGAGMECYIEVYNGIDERTELKKGQRIKIPKLKTKKSMKKK